MKMIDPKFEKFAFEKLGLVTARDADGNYIEPETSRAWAVWQEATGRSELADSEDLIAIPRGLIGAACYAVRKLNPESKLLPKLREYTTGAKSTALDQQAGAPAFPERDPTKPASQQGLYNKFYISRVDGSDVYGGKHYACRYFVLDLTHDQHAPAALRAYADSCASSHPQLAADLRAEFGAAWTPASNPPDADTTVMLALADGEVWQGYWDGGDWIEVSGLRLAPGRVKYWQHTPKHPEDRS